MDAPERDDVVRASEASAAGNAQRWVGRLVRRDRSARPGGDAGLVRWLVLPVVAVMVVVALASGSVWLAVAAEEASVRERLVSQTGSVATLLEVHLEQDFEVAEGRAVELLAAEDVGVSELRTVVVGLGYTIGAVFDDGGRLLVGLPFREDFVGRDFTEQLEHLRVAEVQGRPTVSQVIVSPALETPVVGLAVPFATPSGRRVLTLVRSLQTTLFAEVLGDAEVLEGFDAHLLDRDSNLIATSHGPLSAEVVALDDRDPAAAAALGRGASGEFVAEDGQQMVFATAPVGRTGWTVLIRSPAEELFAGTNSMRRNSLGSVAALAVLGLAIAVVIGRHRRDRAVAEAEVRELNATLQERVERRTAELQTANAQLQNSNARLEAALAGAREGEQASRRLAAVAEGAGEAIIGEDADGTIISWNDAARRLYGYTAEEAIGQHMTLLSEAGGEDEAEELLAAALESGEVTRVETRRRSRDGFPRWVAISKAPIRDGDGELGGVVSIHLDVTELERARAGEQQAEALFESVFRSGAPQAVTSMDGRILDVNEALCEMLGRDREQLLQMTATAVTHPDDRALTAEYFTDLKTGRRRYVQQRKRYTHADGHTVHGLLHLTHVASPDRDDVLVGFVQDITAQAESEEQLAQREALLSGVTSSSANVTTVYDTAGRCVFAAGAGMEAVGLTVDDLVGSYFVERHGDNPPMMDALRRALSGEAVDVVTEFRGSVFDARLRPVDIGDAPTHVAVAATDVTEMHRAKEAQQRYAAELEALNSELESAVEVRQHILDATTHELRTPLTPIVGMLEVLRKHWHDLTDEDRLVYFEVIERNTARIGTLVEDLLFASRIRGGMIPAAVEPIRVTEHVDRALAKWPEMATVDVHGDPDAEAWCQPNHLEQILDSLLSNAATYGAPPYEIDVSADDEAVVISVEDHGPGLRSDLYQRVFEPFVQGSEGDRRTARGLGLGLYIAQTLARANAGDLVHEGFAGSSRFVLTLWPVLADEPHPTPAAGTDLAST